MAEHIIVVIVAIAAGCCLLVARIVDMVLSAGQARWWGGELIGEHCTENKADRSTEGAAGLHGCVGVVRHRRCRLGSGRALALIGSR